MLTNHRGQSKINNLASNRHVPNAEDTTTCRCIKYKWELLHIVVLHNWAELCLSIHTHWEVGNCMGKCIKCLDALHRIEPFSYTASCTLIANCSNPAS